MGVKKDLFKQIKFTGTDIVKSSSGNVVRKYTYVNGEKHGAQVEWFDDGQLFKKHNYVNEKQHGIQRNWNSNGQLSYEYNYENGKKHGIQRSWNSTGKLNYEHNYVNGKRHGVQRELFGNTGKEIRFFINGEQCSEDEWEKYNQPCTENIEHRETENLYRGQDIVEGLKEELKKLKEENEVFGKIIAKLVPQNCYSLIKPEIQALMDKFEECPK